MNPFLPSFDPWQVPELQPALATIGSTSFAKPTGGWSTPFTFTDKLTVFPAAETVTLPSPAEPGLM